MQKTSTQANSIDATNAGPVTDQKKKLRLGKIKVWLIAGIESDVMIFRELPTGVTAWEGTGGG